VNHNFYDLAQRIEHWMFSYSYVSVFEYIVDKQDSRSYSLERTLRFRLYA